ncbi:hypothetical protein QJS66_22485 [Kocuria rhizophila]|nr:hypothetical protein QJS66_22485 [Kocuria rhizophila]
MHVFVSGLDPGSCRVPPARGGGRVPAQHSRPRTVSVADIRHGPSPAESEGQPARAGAAPGAASPCRPLRAAPAHRDCSPAAAAAAVVLRAGRRSAVTS